ncbi:MULTISPECIES: hypothetical protein [unclassified Streptomyces]|uniref:hypothetical protein n=1 Tax=unclassified Streptomyces TaxID=2593676 RepID=UPI0033A31B2C
MTRDPYDDLMISLGLTPSTPPRKAIAECGTYSGYCRHIRRRETPCQLCRDAKNTYDRAYRDEKRAALPTPPKRGIPRGSEQVGGVPPAPREHGTARGARQHWKYREPVCDACSEAYNAWQAQHRARRAAA